MKRKRAVRSRNMYTHEIDRTGQRQRRVACLPSHIPTALTEQTRDSEGARTGPKNVQFLLVHTVGQLLRTYKCVVCMCLCVCLVLLGTLPLQNFLGARVHMHNGCKHSCTCAPTYLCTDVHVHVHVIYTLANVNACALAHGSNDVRPVRE